MPDSRAGEFHFIDAGSGRGAPRTRAGLRVIRGETARLGLPG